jgi:polysaccharide export outer membrane protein
MILLTSGLVVTFTRLVAAQPAAGALSSNGSPQQPAMLLAQAAPQTATPPTDQVRPPIDSAVAAPAAAPSLPNRKIAPGDLLSISVLDEPDLSATYRVAPDGALSLPLMKSGLRAGGLLPRELETEIVRAWVEQQILVHPIVSVSVQEYAAALISVVGDVKSPGQYPITGSITLLEALTKAGWVTPAAASELLFSKSESEAPRKIDISRILAMSSDPTVNLTLTGGELIDVPDAPKVWVTGETSKAQAVPIRSPADATVLKVVTSASAAPAHGATQHYARTAYIYRADAQGVRHPIEIPLKDIMNRKVKDVPLQADDILLIPALLGEKRPPKKQVPSDTKPPSAPKVTQ